MQIYLILPAYNERENITSLLRAIALTSDQLLQQINVIVVDDGSTDDTPGSVRQWTGGMDIRVLEHEVNAGLGAAILTGVCEALLK